MQSADIQNRLAICYPDDRCIKSYFQPEQMDSGPLLNIINGKANFNFPPFYKKTRFAAEYFIVLLKSL